MVAITKYADRLIEDLKDLDFIDRVKSQQPNEVVPLSFMVFYQGS